MSSSKPFGKSVITWFIASGLLATIITIGWPDIMNRAYLIIKVIRHDDDQPTESKIAIYNIGRASAMNLRVTINPEYNITDYKIDFYTENVTISSVGPRSLIANLPRLAPGAQIQIAVFSNTTESSPYFRVWANYDTGSASGTYETEVVTEEAIAQRIMAMIILAYALLAGVIGLLVYPFINQWRRFGSPFPCRTTKT